ncbi:hypothetical protein [Pasteuria penetrans]|nr:hypothetical protein [Pasteuria penetrans]
MSKSGATGSLQFLGPCFSLFVFGILAYIDGVYRSIIGQERGVV